MKAMLRMLMVGASLGAALSARSDATVKVDCGEKQGRFKPVHGVNNGPYSLSSLTLRLQKYHAEAGFPFVRLHDVPLAYAAPYAVDISAVFPCPDADENDPRYYTFAKTDAVIGAIVKNGAQVIYRLGQSIEHRDKFHVNPPKDVEKWARVCVNIVRHYNEGWAGGFQYGIQRWEIWNEPDITPCWTGTREQFFDLYVAAAKALKAHDPSLKIGGPGITSPYSGMAEPFLACCRERKAPLDFFSWHCYAVAPDDVVRTAVKARDELAAAGFAHAESYCTEWREMPDWAWREWDATARGAAAIDEMFGGLNGLDGLVFCGAVLLRLQDAPIDIANFYTGDALPRWGLFDRYGYPHKLYYAFPAYQMLFATENRVKVEGALESALFGAGVASDGKSAALMIVSLARGRARTVNLSFANLPWTGPTRCEVWRADARYDLEKTEEKSWMAGQTFPPLSVPERAIVVVKLCKK